MNGNIINEVSNDMDIKSTQVESVLKLLSEGNTIPFIARYRKEATGALDEEQIRKINEYYEYEVNLLADKIREVSLWELLLEPHVAFH